MSGPTPLPSAPRLVELIHAMAGQPILMLVDLVADRFVTGSPKRISREAPVLILKHEDERLRPGGGANAIANVAALGGRPLPVGIVGDDESGTGLLDALTSAGIPTTGILRHPTYHTPTKTRILGGGRHSIKQQIVRIDREETLRLSPSERQEIRDHIARLRGAAHVAVLSDYGYGTVEPELVADIRSAIGDEGSILCDSRYRLGDFHGLDGATPNEEEAESLLGATLSDSGGQLGLGGQKLLAQLGTKYLLITRGSLGLNLFAAGGYYRIPVHGTDQVADVTGAGDTVIGTFALAIAAGASPLEAALLANYAGGIVVMKQGTATPVPAELEFAVRSDHRPVEELRWEKC